MTTQQQDDPSEPTQPPEGLSYKKTTKGKKAARLSKHQSAIPDLNDPKTAAKIEKVVKVLEAHHQKSDSELMQEIQIKPENQHKVTHQLDKEQQDARLVLMHRLLIRKVSPSDIQKQLGITQEMYYYLRPKLDALMRLDISKLDVPYMIGDSLALYDEVRSMALLIASSSQVKDTKTKLQAMNVVLKAESDKNAFLTQCGVYAPQIIEHLIHGMVSSGATLMLSGPGKASAKRVEDMVGDLMKVLAATSPSDTATEPDYEEDSDENPNCN